MQLGGITQGLSQLFQRTGSTALSSAPAASDEQAVSSSTPQANAALQNIVNQYNLESISPRELAALATELQRAGGLSPKELQGLQRLRQELEESGVGADEPIDLLQFVQQRMSQFRQNATQARQSGADPQVVASADLTANFAIEQSRLIDKLTTLQHPNQRSSLDVST